MQKGATAKPSQKKRARGSLKHDDDYATDTEKNEADPLRKTAVRKRKRRTLTSPRTKSPPKRAVHDEASDSDDSNYQKPWRKTKDEDDAWEDEEDDEPEEEAQTSTSSSRKTTANPSHSSKMGNRKYPKQKRKVDTHPVTRQQQMDAMVKDKLDACIKPMDTLQKMSRPFSRAAAFDGIVTEDSVHETEWPNVCHGLFCMTEQEPNPNGGEKFKGRRRIRPLLTFFTGSRQMNKAMKDFMKKYHANEADIEFHASFEGHKNALYDHPSIAQPQVNTAARRKENEKKKMQKKK